MNFFVRDLSGTGHHFNTNQKGLSDDWLPTIDPEDQDQREEFKYYIDTAEVGDTYEIGAELITRTD